MTSRRKWIWRGGLAVLALLLSVAAWAAHQRYVRKNFHPVVDGQVYRSAQPSVEDFREWQKRHGIASVLSLQGWAGTRAVIEERQVVESLGMRFAFNYMSADRLPSPGEVRGLVNLLDTLPRPLLIHCRGGVDRTGMASVLAAMSIGGQSYRDARSHLSVRYFYGLKPGTNINDLFDDYETYCGRTGSPTAGWKELRAWLEGVYKPSYYHAIIEPPASLAIRPGEATVVQVKVTNGAHAPIPLAARQFDLIALVQSDEAHRFTKNVWGRVTLTGTELAPGASLVVPLRLQAPAEPGTTNLCLDLEEVGGDRFAIYGSPMAVCTVTVK
jgi:protein tyrosine phosphatase (PTP) superfamily phosphohydrolase (DUF442 family)